MRDTATKPGHLKTGGEISLPQTEKVLASIRKSRQRVADENRKSKPAPINMAELGWVRKA